MKKTVKIIVTLTFVGILMLSFWMCLEAILRLSGITEIEEVYHKEKVETSEIKTIVIPEEQGMPQMAKVQIACDHGPGRREFQEVYVIKTDKGLYLESKLAQSGEFFEGTELFGAGFEDKKLLPAVVGGRSENSTLYWGFKPGYYSYSVVGVPCDGPFRNGVMENYTCSIEGQNVRFVKTYKYVYKPEKVRRWYWKERVSEVKEGFKETFADLFTF
ncbi:MAG: hypothetical protein IKS23_05510 [Alphaproteobacteria bacterium]|nr:hypothetical protein [Alphaproteobacteria bacterium]